MLEELTVRDFALIERLCVRFGPGLSLLTGETGAGKSILIGAIGFLLGERADTGLIRTGAEETVVSGVFSLKDSPRAKAWLEARGASADSGRLSIRRALKANGRGSIHVQDAQVARNELLELTSLIVDLHGQHDHQVLLKPESHRVYLDRYAGLEAELGLYGTDFLSLSAKRRSFEKMLASERDRERAMELLGHAIGDIAAVKPVPGEDEALALEEKLLSQHEKLYSLVEQAREGLADPEGGAVHALRKARQAAEGASAVDPGLAEISRRLDDAYYEVEDLSSSLTDYLERATFDQGRLEAVGARLAELGRLKKRYGGSIEAVLSRFEEDKAELERFENWDSDRESLEGEIASMERAVYDRALAISAKRAEAAAVLEGKVAATVRGLGMPEARFKVGLERKEPEEGRAVVGPFGIDEVEFLIAPNPGEPLRPLARIASGGEISRVMLALKTALAESDETPVLIFDEIDTGVGGEVAASIGEHLRALGRSKQVFCITHLASIAVRADNHYRVEKEVSGGRTATRLSIVQGMDKAREVARMLAGDPGAEASLAHAIDLLGKQGNWQEGR